MNSAVPRNYTWHVLRGSKFFNSGGSFDRDLAEYVMTMVGTIIYVPPTDSDPGRFQPLTGDTTSTLVTALLDGNTLRRLAGFTDAAGRRDYEVGQLSRAAK